MPYLQNIPQPTDQLDDSQGDILGNFQEIYNLVGVNHVQFGAAAGQGKHTQVTLPENAAPTNTAAAEANIYSQLSTLTNNTELFWQREGNGTRIEWTGLLAATNGWTRLPSGILLKWGADVVATNLVVVYPAGGGIPAFQNIPNNPFVTLVTTSGTAAILEFASLVAGSQTRLQFSVQGFVNGSPGTSGFKYLSIGI